MNGVNGTYASTNDSNDLHRRYRPPTVDDALPYSPLSSIVPFESGIIPVPSIRPASSGLLFVSQAERLSSRKDYKSLNIEASKLQGTSSRLQKTLADLEQLLYADKLTQFKFRRHEHLKDGIKPQHQDLPPDHGINGAQPPEPGLTTFAGLVLESTQVSYCYRSIVSPTWQPLRSKPYRDNRTFPRTPQENLPSSPPLSISNQIGFLETGKAPVQVQAHGLLTPGKTPPIPVVIIPKLPPSSTEADYKAYPHIDAQVQSRQGALPKKRKRQEANEKDDVIAVHIDERRQADVALQIFEELLGEIFEAEDRLQVDTSGIESADVANYFVRSGFGEGGQPGLARAICHRLESSLQSVVSLGRFKDVPIEQLSRLQKLCEGVLDSVEALDLTIGSGWNDEDIETWLQRIGVALNALQASKIVLKIMTAGYTENQLHPEELLQKLVNTLRHVFDCCVVPAFECRRTESQAEQINVLLAHQKFLSTVVQNSGKVLRLLGGLLSKVEASESIIAAIQFLAMGLIFVETASTDKDSAIGIQRFENIRRYAMDVVARVFFRYPNQRTFVFDEILTSLEKLPVARQSARQYKLLDGKPIQLVSALIMRLIQTSAMHPFEAKRPHGVAALTEGLFAEGRLDSEDKHDQPQVRKQSPTNSDVSKDHPDNPMQQMLHVVRPLYEAAQSNAHYVVKYMVQRALNATKKGDQPYRNLLDIFTEDFLAVLGSADWPAAELLLRSLLSNLIGLIESDKSTVPARNMALDLMGLMASGITDLQIYARHAHRNMQAGESEVEGYLRQISDEVLADSAAERDLVAKYGPHRISLEYLQSRDLDDPQLQSACGFYLVQWAKHIATAFEEEQRDETKEDAIAECADLTSWITKTILDPRRLQYEYHFPSVSTAQARLSYALTILTLPFCKAQKRVLSILLNSMSNDHASVKSKSLKSVVQLLEKDPSILDRGSYIVGHILRCCTDPSSLVRDSAVSLLGKCISLRPALEAEVFKAIIARSADAAVGVRKRAMKLLKDIYLRNHDKQVKTLIAEALLHRVYDSEQSVSDLARQMFEDVWMSPYNTPLTVKEDSLQTDLALREQVSLIVNTVQRGENIAHALESLFQNAFSATSKNAAVGVKVCRSMVAIMFDGIIDNTDLPGKPSQQRILQSLTVFAKANPMLFTAEQLELLQPYVENLATTDDLHVYRSVLIIFRHVFPTLSSLKDSFLKAVQDALLGSVGKLGKTELNEVSSCLWTINGMLKNTDRLTRLVVSVLKGIQSSENVDLTNQAQQAAATKIKRYMMIAGFFGRACNFESNSTLFRESFPLWKGDSVSGLMVDMLCPFASIQLPAQIREVALESIGMICQAWPKHFLKAQVNAAFDVVFRSHDERLEHVILCSLKNLFVQEELQSTPLNERLGTDEAHTGSEKLGKSFAPNENDGVSTSVAQRFLPEILRICLTTTGGYALAAAEIIASIGRQGLVHPKECGPVLVALETSPNAAIATLAFQEHRALHHKHETMLEKEYMKAVYQAFAYQRDVVGDPLGVTFHPLNAKLRPLFEVLKLGNVKIRKRFLCNLCGKVDLGPGKLDSSEAVPPHLQYTRFIVENLALFDYSRVDELLHLVLYMEKIVAGTGTGIAHAIETELLNSVSTADQSSAQESGIGDLRKPEPVTSIIESDKLRHLTVSSAVLSMLWETRTFLRRLWGLPKHRDAKVKATVKELNKVPVKSSGVSPEHYLQIIGDLMASTTNAETMVAQCKAFVQLLSLDDEMKVASDDEADVIEVATGYDTPNEEGIKTHSVPPSGGGRRRKRKGSVSAAPTPRKARRAATPGTPRRKSKAGNMNEDVDMDWE